MVVDDLNNNETEMIGMKPIDAIKLKRVNLYIKPYSKERCITILTGLYIYLYKAGEMREVVQSKKSYRFRIGRWDTFRLDKIINSPSQRVLYYLAGKDGSSEQLL